MLTSKQRSNLRSLAQTIEPITQVGKLGVNDSLIEGLDQLKKAVFDVLSKLPPLKPLEFEEFNYVKPDRLDYEIFKEGETFVIEGTLVDVLKRNVVMDDMNSLAYLQKVLKDRGIIKQLRAMGATDKSTVIIGGEEFEFVD